jgi:hypothetical protein
MVGGGGGHSKVINNLASPLRLVPVTACTKSTSTVMLGSNLSWGYKKYSVGIRTVGVRFPVETKICSLIHSVQTGSAAKAACC